MSADVLIASYLRIAREDLAGARQLASTGNRNAMYLCSQAAEKIIRAVLTSEGKNAGIKHQLDELVDMIPERFGVDLDKPEGPARTPDPIR
jgi:HEPN domain-containing protein